MKGLAWGLGALVTLSIPTQNLTAITVAARLSGTILDRQSDQPVRRAIVTLAGAGLGEGLTTVSDEDGNFEFVQLPPGRFTLTARKAGYIPCYYGSSRPGRGPGLAIALEADQAINDLSPRIQRGSVIGGHITDELGRDWPGLPVSLLTWRSTGGARTLVPAAQTRTDDRGQYRFFGLEKESYLIAAMATDQGFEGAMQSTPELWQQARSGAAVSASPLTATVSDDRRVGYAPIIYPGVSNPAEARSLELGWGEERLGVDFVMRLMPTATITGRLADLTGQPIEKAQLNIITPVHRLGFRQQVLRTLSAIPTTAVAIQNGRFQVDWLPPGHYTLTAQAVRATMDSGGQTRTETIFAVAELDLDARNTTDLVMTLRPGFDVGGRLTFDGDTPTDLSRFKVRLLPWSVTELARPPDATAVQKDGTFSITGVASGRYRLEVEGDSQWFLRDAQIGGMDVLDQPLHVKDTGISGLVVALTTGRSQLTGVLRDTVGRPAPECRILVFAADRKYWESPRRIRYAQPGSDGRYVIQGLPAGDYLLVGVTELTPDELSDPVVLDSLVTSATRLSIAPGESKTLDLRLSGK